MYQDLNIYVTLPLRLKKVTSCSWSAQKSEIIYITFLFCFAQQRYNAKDGFRCIPTGITGSAAYQRPTVASGIQTYNNTNTLAGILMLCVCVCRGQIGRPNANDVVSCVKVSLCSIRCEVKQNRFRTRVGDSNADKQQQFYRICMRRILIL
ncbi:Hypothetical_protein [Hexamita inflata]|uniref:Hypothetical_protein n=1 Tax=Hexamita inflata TaxID=28002 RepID=A0AA86QSU8_9EUKA|nr:Hypothetical protein HINF_LOCUS50093 [Hexamita inflata]CAI9962450.1 Hypothetical protein HINF_LOCUS50095 [Hexamita inflata]CAI9962452.1 Hypothetical protein HINF_LOCUS50097 [Hexamita inflata]CAI9962458.1 Hypothetical protein HINF_LOCUS50103 [Hexamita inflata]